MLYNMKECWHWNKVDQPVCVNGIDTFGILDRFIRQSMFYLPIIHSFRYQSELELIAVGYQSRLQDVRQKQSDKSSKHILVMRYPL